MQTADAAQGVAIRKTQVKGPRISMEFNPLNSVLEAAKEKAAAAIVSSEYTWTTAQWNLLRFPG